MPSSGTAGSALIAVTVPVAGSFTITVAAGTVNLPASGLQATGQLNPVTVSDTRNNVPGWSVSGQVADFTGSGATSGSTISGNQLGWSPLGTCLATGFTLGAPVAAGSPGLGATAAVLASAHSGGSLGTCTMGASLTLAIPADAKPGDYNSTLTVTAVTAFP